MALGFALDRRELKDDGVLLVGLELRINHLNKSVMNKIVRSASVILCSIRRRRSPSLVCCHVQNNICEPTGIRHWE